MTPSQSYTLSVVIPAYNESRYLDATLKALVLNASPLIHEIIVVDNNSSDGTAAVAAGFANVRVIKEITKGVNRARERGFREATGELVAFLDADCRVNGDWAPHIARVFSHERETVLLSGPYRYYDAPAITKWFARYIWWGVCARLAYWITGYMAIGGNVVLRRATLEAMGGYDTTIAFYGDDTDLARRAKSFGKVRFDFSFTVESSARRFSGQGLMKTAWLYGANFLSEVFLHRPATTEYTDIR